jgi:hypothetical protein
LILEFANFDVAAAAADPRPSAPGKEDPRAGSQYGVYNCLFSETPGGNVGTMNEDSYRVPGRRAAGECLSCVGSGRSAFQNPWCCRSSSSLGICTVGRVAFYDACWKILVLRSSQERRYSLSDVQFLECLVTDLALVGGLAWRVGVG